MSKPIRFKAVPIGRFFMIEIAGRKVKAKRETASQVVVRKVNSPGFVALTFHPDLNQDDCFLLDHEGWDDPPVQEPVKVVPTTLDPISLLAEAHAEISWWVDNHTCCRGHEDYLLKRIEQVVPEEMRDQAADALEAME